MEMQSHTTAFQADAFQFDAFQIFDEDYVGPPAKAASAGTSFARAKSKTAPILNAASAGAPLGNAR